MWGEMAKIQLQTSLHSDSVPGTIRAAARFHDNRLHAGVDETIQRNQ